MHSSGTRKAREEGGRPQITWRRQVEEDMKRGDISWREAARNAQDRDKWKSVVCGLYPEIG